MRYGYGEDCFNGEPSRTLHAWRLCLLESLMIIGITWVSNVFQACLRASGNLLGLSPKRYDMT